MPTPAQLAAEVARRRTFAIISHPDAGKTTLTEKLLLYGGQIQLAGSVTARKNQRATTSDWMELEKQRGISISSTVLQFDYSGYRVNLLDTPGHKDFSEDTYRVLTAVDSAVMVIDAAKGIEPQTLKLFQVCRRRGVPIFTFMNKLDRPTRDPFELLDELERILGIEAFPVNWPLGSGPTFRGVYDRLEKQLHLFEKTPGGGTGIQAPPVAVTGLHDPKVAAQVDPAVLKEATDAIEMLEGAGAAFDPARVMAGQTTPVFFGSAMNNFGVQLLLDNFLKYSSPPTPRRGRDGDGSGGPVNPTDEKFSGFVFKIQANMDPRHRDRIAFVRVVSGRFERDMFVLHAQSGKRVRLGSAQKLFGQERHTIDEAFAGDVIGLIGNDMLGIGDTLTEDRSILFDEIPRFAPEVFAFLHNPSTANAKKFRLGLDQLLKEGVVQVLEREGAAGGAGGSKVPLLAAVGPLQFEVVQYRLQSEYGAESRLEPTPWTAARWLEDPAASYSLPDGSIRATDRYGMIALLFPDQWAIGYFQKNNPSVKLLSEPPSIRQSAALAG
jgi:peptide chain release factor 3